MVRKVSESKTLNAPEQSAPLRDALASRHDGVVEVAEWRSTVAI